MNVFLALFFGKRVEKFAHDVYEARAHKKQLLALFSFAFFSAAATTTAGVQVAHDATRLLKFSETRMMATILFCFNTATTRFVGAYDLPKRIFMSTANGPVADDFSLPIKKIFKIMGVSFASLSLLLIPMWAGLTQEGIEKLDSNLSKKELSAYTFTALLSNPLFYAVSCFDAPKNMITLAKELHVRLHNETHSAVVNSLKTAVMAALFVILGVASGSGYSKEMATMLATSFGSVFNEIISDKDIHEVYGPIHAAYMTMLIVGMVNMNGTAGFFVKCLETEKKYGISFMRALFVYLGFLKAPSDVTIPFVRSTASGFFGSGDVLERSSSPFLSHVSGCFKTAMTNCCAWFHRQQPVAAASSPTTAASVFP